jgi:hypothetical protein
VEDRIRLLTETYRSLHERYREIETLSETERTILAERGEIAEVNGILRRKREILREIRIEEERVMGAREWWKKIRRTLAPERGRDLLSLLDAISRRVERILALEAECRELLSRSVAWGAGSAPPSASGSAATAAAAYGRVPASAPAAPAASSRGLR